jgi:aminopeptidase-like protein
MLNNSKLGMHEDYQTIGQEMFHLIETLYPICRSITGEGVRQTLKLIREHVPIHIYEVPTGTRVFDWQVPKEWNIEDAYIKDAQGRKVIDFKKHNLHVLNYSTPINMKLTLQELKKHIYTIPDKPDWIPYKTSYYKEDWGFCMSHRQLMSLEDGEYEVLIDSTLEPGSLTYGEHLIKGRSKKEILLSCHVCHPSLCNDNLSGIALMTYLAAILNQRDLYYSYRFLFIPGTIGSITWLSLHENQIHNIQHGLVVTCVGDPGGFIYKRSRAGDAAIDRVVENVLANSGTPYSIIDFYPYGYDERQYCSPGFNLPVGSLSRSTHGCYPEYHTSADNVDLIKPECLDQSLSMYLSVMDILENDRTYLNMNPKCEPQLGKRGLYDPIGVPGGAQVNEMALLWVLNMSDGKNSLLDIAEKAKMNFAEIQRAADALKKCGLLELKPDEF